MSDETPQSMQMNVVVNLGEEEFRNHHIKIVDEELPILPLRGEALFPAVIMPVHLARKSAVRLVRDADKAQGLIIISTQRDDKVEEPELNDLYPVGCAARIIKLIHAPFGNHVVLLMGVGRVKLLDLTTRQPYLKGHVTSLEDIIPETDDTEYVTLYNAVVDQSIRLTQYKSQLPSQMIESLKSGGPRQPVLVNFMCGHVNCDIKDRMKMLEQNDMKQRCSLLLYHIGLAIREGEMKQEILVRTQEKIDTQQRKYFLHEQMRQIEKELGDNDIDSRANKLREQGKQKHWPDKVAEMFESEVSKLAMNDPHSFDFNMQLNYLETLVGLPWGDMSSDKFSLKHAQKTLNRDHYGLQKIKERIIEHLAVLKLRGDNKSPIICLVGPPGVGKTSLGKSIANALGREYVRISLGGVHDESEIRGHRRTYIGAMPGRIIKSLQRASKDNPVFVLDEMDKVGGYSNHGDPSSALLEVLDPEQNTTFHDNYLDVDYDLSHVMFIATANTTGTIPAPLLDRMEVIELSGYVVEEKVEIARRHLIGKVKKECGLQDVDIKITRPALLHLINNYTRESGVRGLEKRLAQIMRKVAVKITVDNNLSNDSIGIKEVEALIGKPEYVREDYQGNDFAGVVTGLAWTQVGGEILFIESSLSPGKGGQLTMTGNLGDVMKESAMLALEYIKAHADELNIDHRIFESYNIHVHVPEGATPKDGPSAGITMTTSMVSALTQRKVRRGLAMTGEITLRGKVLPVGGIKEKILAAKRAGITDIMLCEGNRRNVEKIEPLYVKGLTFHYVETIRDALTYALLDEKVAHPQVFTFPEKNKD